MGAQFIAEAVAVVKEEFLIEIADTPELTEEAYRVRHQVYCIERGFEAGDKGFETDEFDVRAPHVVIRNRASGDVVGTVRLVLPSLEAPRSSFPMQSACDAPLLHHIPLRTTAEISRFSLSKDRRARSVFSAGLMRLGLMQGIVRLSGNFGLTHWCALMEPSLLRLLRSTAIHFHPLGAMVEHHGIRQPSYGSINDILGRMNQEQPVVWDFITGNGRFWSQGAALVA